MGNLYGEGRPQANPIMEVVANWNDKQRATLRVLSKTPWLPILQNHSMTRHGTDTQ